MNKRTLLIFGIVMLLTALVRVWIPWNNFSPIGAIALVGGAMLGRKWLAFVLPLFSLFVGDLVLSGISPTYSGYLFSGSFLFVYTAFIIIVLMGMFGVRNMKWSRLIGMGIVASIAFFLITNFGVWAFYNMYPKNITGLLESYAAGLPFFKNTLISQLVFTVILSLILRPVFRSEKVQLNPAAK